MKKNKILTINPHTSIVVSSFKKMNEFLRGILLSRAELSSRKIDKPVVLYGAGNLGKMARNFFDYLHMPFLYVVDKNAKKYKHDEYWRGVNVVHPKDVKGLDKKNFLLVLCVASVPLVQLRNELKNKGWEDVVFFYDVSEAYRRRYPLSNGWFLNKLNKNERGYIEKIFYSLADDVSRAHYLQFIAWRKLRAELVFENISIVDNRFFIPEVTKTLQDNEVFIDCGAHKGLVLENFLKVVSNKYNTIHAIEPDRDSFAVLESKTENVPKINLASCALSDSVGRARFCHGFDFASKLSKKGNCWIKTASLDSFDIPATFIKMHLEGGELDALAGAAKTIEKNRPIVAVTIYHNTDGAWRIPLFLMSKVENYKYHMRLHSWGGEVAIFYAIPKERGE